MTDKMDEILWQARADAIWDRVYDFNGHALANYLNDFFDTRLVKSSQHGEFVYIEDEYRGQPMTIFNKWSKWRETVSYTHKQYADEIDEVNEDTIAVFVYRTAAALGILDRTAKLTELEAQAPHVQRTEPR